MIRFFLFLNLFLILLFSSCTGERGEYSDDSGNNPKTLPADSLDDSEVLSDSTRDSFGVRVQRDGAVPVTSLSTLMTEEDSLNIKLRGTIAEVCQKKGCWMTMDIGSGNTMRVTFRDYGFFIPKDAHGKKVIIKGTAKKELVTVEALRHYAQDAGKTAEEVSAIAAPERQFTFVADGLMIE